MTNPTGPLPTLADVERDTAADTIVDECSSFDDGDGYKVTIRSHFVVIEVRHGGTEQMVWIPIVTLLDSIADHTRKIGS